jgi:hypothetical protein
MTEVPPHKLISDEELSKQLHQLFVVEQHETVTLQHPVEGDTTITKAEYLDTLKHLKRAADMSPAQRHMESKRLERQQQIKFRTAMITAQVYTVDLEDEDNFGKDVDGNEMDINQMIFVPVDDYLNGIIYADDEVGAFVDSSMRRPPIRIKAIPQPDHQADDDE